MDAFSYLSVLLSIILGLGITQILTAAGRLIRGRRAVIPYWPPLVWAGLLLVVYVQAWWAMFELRTHESWTFVGFLVVLLQTITLYMLAALVLPDGGDGGSIDLRAHYDEQAPWFFGFLAATVVVSALKEVVLEGSLPEPANLAFHVVLLAVSAVAMVVRRDWLQKVVAVASAGVFTLYIAMLFSQLR